MKQLNWQDDDYEIMCTSCQAITITRPSKHKDNKITCSNCGEVFDAFDGWRLSIDTRTQDALDLFDDFQDKQFNS